MSMNSGAHRAPARRAATAALGLLMLAGGMVEAFAADITINMRNNHKNAVEVELYSQDREHVDRKSVV